MPTNPAWRYFDRDPILRDLIRDGVPITVENYIGAVWRSELPDALTKENSAFLADLCEYEASVARLHGRSSVSREG
jgi:hypothetical protein